jgi:hypothetical protein
MLTNVLNFHSTVRFMFCRIVSSLGFGESRLSLSPSSGNNVSRSEISSAICSSSYLPF